MNLTSPKAKITGLSEGKTRHLSLFHLVTTSRHGPSGRDGLTLSKSKFSNVQSHAMMPVQL